MSLSIIDYFYFTKEYLIYPATMKEKQKNYEIISEGKIFQIRPSTYVLDNADHET